MQAMGDDSMINRCCPQGKGGQEEWRCSIDTAKIKGKAQFFQKIGIGIGNEFEEMLSTGRSAEERVSLLI